jgi:hypothetical protein
MADDERTPEQIARDEAERPGNWPNELGPPYHRHFANDAVHRDGGPECNQPGTPRRVYVFDPDYLSEHEAFITRRVAEKVREQAGRYLEARYGKDVWYAAPETFNNTLERWVWAVASGYEDTVGEECMTAIEAHMAAQRG